MSSWDILLQQIINGVSLGAMYSLLALGFTMVYGVIELINFAHFNVFMVGSFIALWMMQALGFVGQAEVLYGLPLVGVLLLVLVGTMLCTGAIGAFIERYGLRALRGASGTAPMITTIGISYILFNLVLLSVGAESKNYANPMPPLRWEIGEAVLRLRDGSCSSPFSSARRLPAPPGSSSGSTIIIRASSSAIPQAFEPSPRRCSAASATFLALCWAAC